MFRAGIAQSVSRMATGWTVGGSKAGGEKGDSLCQNPSRKALEHNHLPPNFYRDLPREVKGQGA